MSNAFDMKGYRRNYMPARYRDDPYHDLQPDTHPVLDKLQRIMVARDLDRDPIPDCAILNDALNPFAVHDETESPIERMMQLALMFRASLKVSQFSPVCLFAGSAFMPECPAVQIIPQYRVGVYRTDLAVGYFDRGQKCRLIVECDGHDFHSSSKEQAARDRQRDRALLAAGWATARFTGSEINADPIACAEEVALALNGLRHDSIAAYEHGRKFERDKTNG